MTIDEFRYANAAKKSLRELVVLVEPFATHNIDLAIEAKKFRAAAHEKWSQNSPVILKSVEALEKFVSLMSPESGIITNHDFNRGERDIIDVWNKIDNGARSMGQSTNYLFTWVAIIAELHAIQSGIPEPQAFASLIATAARAWLITWTVSGSATRGKDAANKALRFLGTAIKAWKAWFDKKPWYGQVVYEDDDGAGIAVVYDYASSTLEAKVDDRTQSMTDRMAAEVKAAVSWQLRLIDYHGERRIPSSA